MRHAARRTIFGPPQAQRAGDHRNRAHRRGCTGEDRREQRAEHRIEHAGRDRDAERVVDEGEGEVLLPAAHRGARQGGPGARPRRSLRKDGTECMMAVRAAMSARNSAVKTKRSAWVVRLVVIALLFPALYPLSAANPGWLLGFDLQARGPHAHDHGSHDHGYSPVPGVQGHPADLRHPLPPGEWNDPEYGRRVVTLPPSRAPPPRTA